MSETVLVGLVAGILGVAAAAIPAYVASRNAPSRRVSDTASIVDASGKVIATLREEIDRLDRQVDEARVEIRELTATIRKLQAQVRGLGEVPVNGR